MNVTVTPSSILKGEVIAPPSKARTHRALFASLLSNGKCVIENPLRCADTEATLHAITSLGARVEQAKSWVIHSDGTPKTELKEINCGESGVTLRFTIPIASLTGATTTFSGAESLMRRPIEPLSQAMKQLGAKVHSESGRVLVDAVKPTADEVRIRGDISSQFISGLLLAAPLMPKGLRMELTTRLESRGYVSLTIEVMKHHGIVVNSNDEMSRFEISPQRYSPATHKIPGDYSSAAFHLCAAAITGSKLSVHGLPTGSSDPDSAVINILSQMGVKTRFREEEVLVEGGKLRGIDLDLRDCPDLGPITAVLGCYAEGQTRISGAGRLRYKESDRLQTITSELNTLGAQIKETSDGLVTQGPCTLKSGEVNSHGDHRIAMALCVAAIGAKDQVKITGAECVNKSYPNFFNDLKSLGVEIIDR